LAQLIPSNFIELPLIPMREAQRAGSLAPAGQVCGPHFTLAAGTGVVPLPGSCVADGCVGCGVTAGCVGFGVEAAGCVGKTLPEDAGGVCPPGRPA
jgi:hypothetical protein